MRMIVAALLGASFLAAAPMPAFAHHKIGHVIPTAAQVQQARAHRNPCNSVGSSPHELTAMQALQDRCRRLRAELAAHPDDAALRAACDRAAQGLTGQPC